MKTTPPKIGIGFRQGLLTVTAPTDQRKNGYTVWQCTCACGNQILLDTRALQRGTIQDCGCKTPVKPTQRDLTSQRFGLLTALEPTSQRSAKGDTIWRCRCDCGQEVLVPSTQLTSGNRKSCGCLSRPEIKNYVGKRFGQLTVCNYANKKGGMHHWLCRCDCGNVTVVGQTLLQSGKTRSCGCLQAKMARENMKYVEGTSVTLLESAANRRNNTNTSGYNGVHLNKKSQKWVAQIGFKGKNYYLGSFENIDDAVKARKTAEEKIYGKFLQWYYETYSPKNL